jgi:hypothetical protein
METIRAELRGDTENSGRKPSGSAITGIERAQPGGIGKRSHALEAALAAGPALEMARSELSDTLAQFFTRSNSSAGAFVCFRPV